LALWGLLDLWGVLALWGLLDLWGVLALWGLLRRGKKRCYKVNLLTNSMQHSPS